MKGRKRARESRLTAALLEWLRHALAARWLAALHDLSHILVTW
jgi:hypothetical protein